MKQEQTVETARSGELLLPGAQADPCCMGTLAQEELAVLQGFYREEREDWHIYLCLQRYLKQERLRHVFHAVAEDERRHAQKLAAAIYLISGRRYCPVLQLVPPRFDGCCVVLRQRYHEESCGAFNYARAAQETADPCLSAMLQKFSRDEQHHAQLMLEMLAAQIER